jgi:hypothetical protein
MEGRELAALPAGCLTARTSGGATLGREAAVLIRRAGAVDVWTDTHLRSIATESPLVEVSRERGLVAIAHDDVVEVVDLATGQPRGQRRSHGESVRGLAWATTGVLAFHDGEVVWLWNPATDRTRALYAGRVSSLVWSADATTLTTTDGRALHSWPIELARGVSPAEVRARIEHLTSARIAAGRALTPAR